MNTKKKSGGESISDALGEVTVSYRYKSNLKNRPKITGAEEAHRVCKLLFNPDKLGLQEQFVILYLNNSNIVIGSDNAFCGGLTGTVVDVRLILVTALKLMATAVIVAHNHPSGNIKASSQDIELTKKLKISLECLDIKLLDHLIVTPFENYSTFTEMGLL